MVSRGATPELPTASHPGVAPARIAAARMVIIEGNRTKAELLHFYCAAHWGFEVIGVEPNCRDGLAAVAKNKPDLVLASLAVAEPGPGEFVGQLHQAAPAAKLVLLTLNSSEYLVHALAAVEWHALIFEPDENLAALAQAIDRVRQGARFVSARIVQCQTVMRADPLAFHKILSIRQQEILVCIAHALTEEEIGRLLGVSETTVVSHLKKIRGKLGVHSTPRLIRYSIEKGFGSVLPRAGEKDPAIS